MKKQTSEPDYIGGEGPLTKEEEIALAQYFSKKKNKNDRQIPSKVSKVKHSTTLPLRP